MAGPETAVDPFDLDAVGLAAAVRRGDVSPVELVEQAIERIERVDPQLNSVIQPRFDRAVEEAQAPPDGPFRGVPFLVKDLWCHTAGDPHHRGMRFLKQLGWREDHDTYLAARFRAAGFVVVGRTNTPELGLLPTTEPVAYGPTRNPWDVSRSAGGSSGGSAAAVAAGLVPAAHASDGGGSIRIPASACGLVGLKPSRGRVSAGPDVGEVTNGLSVELAVTRTVRDAAAILDVAAGRMPGDPVTAPPPSVPFVDHIGADPGRLRIGIMTSWPGAPKPADPTCVDAAELAGRLLESLGHYVEPSAPAALGDPEGMAHFASMASVNVAASLDYWARRTGRPIGPDDVEPMTWAAAELGRSVGGPQVYAAIQWIALHCRQVQMWWEADGWDLLLTPTLAMPPPPIGWFDATPDNPLQPLFRATELVPFTPLFNASGQPAISLPLGIGDDGLPRGVQLVAAYGREDVLLRVAAQLEQAAPWADRRPAVHA